MASTLRTASALILSLSLSLVLDLPSAVNAMNAYTSVGCFKSSTPMTDQGSYTYQSYGYCQEVCYNISMPAMGLSKGSDCYCGSSLPAKADKVDDSNCNTECNGYGQNMCGGDSYWTVFKTGTDDSVSYYGGSASSSASSSSSSASSTAGSSSSSSSGSATTGSVVVTTSSAPGKTVVITLSASSNPTDTSGAQKEHKGGSNTAGIAAGVVVGVVGAAAIAGGAFFFFRNRRRNQVMEEYSKRSQAQDYSATSGGVARVMSVRSQNGNDARLDPDAMLNRRLSDGSIADEQDYSRRILKVTNPDDGR